MELIVVSETYGRHVVYFDDEFAEEVLSRTWHIRKERDKFYCATNIRKGDKGTILKIHVLILKPPHGMQVDHIDGDGLNNRVSNLRVATCCQNNSNRGMYKRNTSGYKGLRWFKRNKKWACFIGYQGRQIYGGLFENKEDAARRYNELAIIYHGEFAKLNKINNTNEHK